MWILLDGPNRWETVIWLQCTWFLTIVRCGKCDWRQNEKPLNVLQISTFCSQNYRQQTFVEVECSLLCKFLWFLTCMELSTIELEMWSSEANSSTGALETSSAFDRPSNPSLVSPTFVVSTEVRTLMLQWLNLCNLVMVLSLKQIRLLHFE